MVNVDGRLTDCLSVRDLVTTTSTIATAATAATAATIINVIITTTTTIHFLLCFSPFHLTHAQRGIGPGTSQFSKLWDSVASFKVYPIR